MKKFFALAVMALAVAGVAKADDEIADYNRVAVSYDNTYYHNNWKESDANWSTNGFGLNYIHGFKLSSSMPMFIELGGNIDFMFYSDSEKDEGITYTDRIQDINLQVPVNYTYRFNVADNFSIAPYLGLNFKLHLLTQERGEVKGHGVNEKSDWVSFFDKDKVGEGYKRFQMGWQVGVNFQYTKFSLGIQYGTDFIPFFSYKGGDKTYRVNTNNLKVLVGYTF